VRRAFFTYHVRCFDRSSNATYHADVRAMETDTPGILLTEADSDHDHYRLTHRQSGMLITGGKFAMTRDVFGLLEAARALGKVTNWRRHAKNVCTAQVGFDTRAVLSKSGIEWVEVKTSPEHKAASLRAIEKA